MKLELEINKGRIADLLCSGFEGGINYWAFGRNITNPSEAPKVYLEDFAEWDEIYPHCHYPLVDGGVYQVTDTTEDQYQIYTLTLPKVESGLKLMAEKYPHHFGNWLSEDDDATTGDVFIQCCLFGEVKYG